MRVSKFGEFSVEKGTTDDPRDIEIIFSGFEFDFEDKPVEYASEYVLAILDYIRDQFKAD